MRGWVRQQQEGSGLSAPAELIAFCKENHSLLVGMLGLYCGDGAVAEELAQETMVRVCRDWSKVRSKDDPAAWTRRVAINLANSYFRRKAAERRAQQRSYARGREVAEPDLADEVALRLAVAALPRRQKTALVLRYYLDLPYSEIARFMDVPLSTAKSLVASGRARLRTQTELGDAEEAWDAG
jgi:RNA polymerase sigma factor (sigma-70 family)